MHTQLKTKLEQLPKSAGVYFHKDNTGEIIYVGKASNLRNRVRSYFQSGKQHDFKTKILVDEIVDVDWLEVDSEVEALFLESAMIKRYMPKFNIELRDNKNFLYIKIGDEEYPRVSFTRRPMDDSASYYGPFTSAIAVKKAMKQLRRAFPYVTHRNLPSRACLHYHIGLCPGPEVDAISPSEYRKSIARLKRYLGGNGGKLIVELEREMKQLARSKHYEEAGRVRDQLNNLKALARQHLFSQEELFDLSRDKALQELKAMLSLEDYPRRIECYDISHLQGTNNTASMVVFSDGVPNRGEYRKFKMRFHGNDDFAHMQEVIQRRINRWESWPKPDVIVIDGGKGQVSSVQKVLDEKGVKVPVIGLAKRYEEIVRPPLAQGSEFEVIRLDKASHLLKMLMHIRDEAHRFAVTYHSHLRSKASTASLLEEVPGIGPATRKKLIKHFGSFRGVKSASEESLIEIVGEKRARAIKENTA